MCFWMSNDWVASGSMPDTPGLDCLSYWKTMIALNSDCPPMFKASAAASPISRVKLNGRFAAIKVSQCSS